MYILTCFLGKTLPLANESNRRLNDSNKKVAKYMVPRVKSAKNLFTLIKIAISVIINHFFQ